MRVSGALEASLCRRLIGLGEELILKPVREFNKPSSISLPRGVVVVDPVTGGAATVRLADPKDAGPDPVRVVSDPNIDRSRPLHVAEHYVHDVT